LLTLTEKEIVTDIKENHRENRVHFSIRVPKIQKMSEAEILKTFKLHTTISCNNFVLFNSERKVKRYSNPKEIMQEHYQLRYELYQKRKEYMVA